MNIYEESLKLHEKFKGKIEIRSKIDVNTKKMLSLVYSPGVAEPCKKIAANKEDLYKYTSKQNTVAIISDGSAVLGLGNIGANAAVPVMEGKAILFKKFGNIDAIPICIETQDSEEIIKIVKNIASTFGGINLEDISAPRCFEIEKRLKEELDIPVFHDDQHGTAIVVLAGLINSLKLVNKKKEDIKIVVNGAGAAGQAICELLLTFGIKNIIICDRKGALSQDDPKCWRKDNHKYLASITNAHKEKGSLKDVIKDSDIFIGVSGPNVLDQDMVKSMKENPIIFAMANPIPEIMPECAIAAGAKIVATGRSDYPNQINNVLVFPGIFRGVFDAKLKQIDKKLFIVVANAIANSLDFEKLNPNKIIPDPFDENVVINVRDAILNL